VPWGGCAAVPWGGCAAVPWGGCAAVPRGGGRGIKVRLLALVVLAASKVFRSSGDFHA